MITLAKNILIGVGNLLMCDDGIGVITAKFLKQNYKYEPEIEILDGGTLGFGLLEYFVEYDNVFIIDTISFDDEIGSIYKIPSHELLGGNAYKKTAHEVEVLQMIEACELYDKKADITIFGIVPKDINSVKIGLSENLKDKFEQYIEIVNDSIKDLGIKVIKEDKYTLNEIISSVDKR